jgi:hypothetical protein
MQVQVVITQPRQHGATGAVDDLLASQPAQRRRDFGYHPIGNPDVGTARAIDLGVTKKKAAGHGDPDTTVPLLSQVPVGIGRVCNGGSGDGICVY